MTNYSFDNVMIAVFVLAAAIQVFVYLRYFLSLAIHRESIHPPGKQAKVSIIIAVKNETENLKANLPLILNQDYADFEVIIVDDHSDKKGTDYLQSLQHNKIQLHQLYEENGKKAAVHKGIAKANSEKLIFIDADCKPKTTLWLRSMSEKLKEEKSIVLGYAPFLKRPTFLNKFIRYEALTTAIQYFSAAILGKAYMGVGRNLAYTKTVFNQSSAFQQHANLISGDDDLLVNEMGRKSTVSICTNAEAHCVSAPSSNWRTYFHQKRRQLQAGAHYRMSDRWRLATFGLAQLMFWISLSYLIIYQLLNPILFTIFVLKLVIQLILYRGIMRKLGEQDLLWMSPFLEIIHLIISIFIGISTWVVKVDRWK